MRPWSPIPIADCGEPLQALPPELLRLQPHPYQVVGAPYGVENSPFRLRSGVVARLLQAQAALQAEAPQLRLAIFDGWRPLAVQRFMVEQSIAAECTARGIDPTTPGPAREAVVAEVGRFWAPPSEDPATPPPHSTGAAVDLTLADHGGCPVPMGSEIDAIGAVSEPDHFRQQATLLPEGEERFQVLRWQANRDLLRSAMQAAGFAQHPNEWWHFSHGDQLWAWRSGERQAIYGRSGG